MKLLFEFKRQYGRERFYPKNAAAVALLAVAGKACLSGGDLSTLEAGRYEIQVNHNNVENMDWRKLELVK